MQLVAEAPDADRLASPAVRVRVSNAADSAREQFRVAWTRPPGGDLGPAVDVYVPPGQSRVVAVPMPARAADMRQITLRGDDEDFDNTAYVVPPAAALERPLFWRGGGRTTATGRSSSFERALPDNPHLAVKVLARAPSAGRRSGRTGGGQAVLRHGFPRRRRSRPRCAARCSPARPSYSPPQAPGRPRPSAARWRAAPASTEVQPSDYAMFGDIDFRHPLFAPFADPHFSDFTKIHIWKYRRLGLETLPAARVLARFDSGDPALVEVPVGAGRLLALLTGWNPEDSQLAVSSKFVPLDLFAARLGGRPSDEASQYFVGDPIPLHPAAAPRATRHPPDGTRPCPAGRSRQFRRRPAARGSTWSNSGRRSLAGRGERGGLREPHRAARARRTGALRGARSRRARPIRRGPRERRALLAGAEAESRQKLWRWLLGATLAVLLARIGAGRMDKRAEMGLRSRPKGTHS